MFHAAWVCSRQHVQSTFVTREFFLSAGVQGVWFAVSNLTNSLLLLPGSIPVEGIVAVTIL